MLVTAGNKVRIETNGAGDKDDLMFRNVGLVTCYSIIEVDPHHLGNTAQDHWLIQAPEGITWTASFPLVDSIPGTSLLTLDVFDNTEAAEIKVNGIKVGTVVNGVPESWKTLSVVVDGTLLAPQNNTLTIAPGLITGSEGPWDDIMIKNIRLYYETRSASAIYFPRIDR
jgi:hypothetical protein